MNSIKDDTALIKEKLIVLSTEACKIENGLNGFKQSYETKGTSTLELLDGLLEEVKSKNSCDTISAETRSKINVLLSSIKSDFSDIQKRHRNVHANISKFKKTVDKIFADDLSNVSTYFAMDSTNFPTHTANFDPPPQTSLYKIADKMTEDELFMALITEELVRNGHGPVAVQLAQEVGFSEEDVGLKRFREVGAMVSALKNGHLQPAKDWLALNASDLEPKTKQLQYVLAKLEFLMDVRFCDGNPAGVIASMSKIVPFAADFPADFEHLMGSLVFLGQSLNGTPYEDLSLSFPTVPSNTSSAATDSQATMAATMAASTSSSTAWESGSTCGGGAALSLLPLISLCEEGEEGGAGCTADSVDSVERPNAFVRAAHLFGSVAFAQLGLSSIDPLRCALASGLRVLPKLRKLQRAFAWFSEYAPMNSNGTHTFPISVELDTVAHRHNIFHCPVIKEVSSATNPPVRLNCGHAITREAFNSLASSDRRKIKCPYCPKDTSRNQVMELFF